MAFGTLRKTGYHSVGGVNRRKVLPAGILHTREPCVPDSHVYPTRFSDPQAAGYSIRQHIRCGHPTCRYGRR